MNYTDILKSSQILLSGDRRYEPMARLDLNNLGGNRTIIKNQFECFGKGNDRYNKLLKEIDEIDDGRCAHIVFTFLLGVYIYDKSNAIKKAVGKKVDKKLESAGHEHDFTFLWFLICLFHDLGYSEENKKENSDVGLCWACSKKLDGCTGVPLFYKNIYQNYFHYRKTEFKAIDHGIYAGLKMYEDLCTIRKEKKENNLNPNCWRKELVSLYNLASWVVLAHNVWFAKDVELEKCAIYEKYQLVKLILHTTKKGDVRNNAYPIRLSDHPVLFLFCLVDLIEPMKRIGKMECCEKIDFEIYGDKVVISSDLDCACVKNYLKEISKAKDWFAKVEQPKDNQVIILLQ